jgi:hypothetical protein
MTFDDVPREIRLAYAAHQRLLRLGFPAEHIYTGENFGRVIVALRLPARQPFDIVCCATKLSSEEYAEKWNAFVRAAQVDKTIDGTVLDKMYVDWPYSDTQLVLALKGKDLLADRTTP